MYDPLLQVAPDTADMFEQERSEVGNVTRPLGIGGTPALRKPVESALDSVIRHGSRLSVSTNCHGNAGTSAVLDCDGKCLTFEALVEEQVDDVVVSGFDGRDDVGIRGGNSNDGGCDEKTNNGVERELHFEGSVLAVTERGVYCLD